MGQQQSALDLGYHDVPDDFVDALFFHTLAVLHEPVYREKNAGALRMGWPRIPCPGWPDGGDDPAANRALLFASSKVGRQLAALLDVDEPVPGVTVPPIHDALHAVACFEGDNLTVERVRWTGTAIDQLAGHHLIQELASKGLPVAPYTTQKDLKDPKGIERLETIDRVEQVQFTIWLRQVRALRWPRSPSPHVQALEEQVAQFAEHKTEAGSVDYYAPGEERDELVKALLAALFSARVLLERGRPSQGYYGAVDLGTERSAELAALRGEGTLHALLQAFEGRQADFGAEFEYAVT